MLSWLRSDPVARLEKQYAKKLEEARDAQRNGKIPLYATLMGEAEEIVAEIDRLKADRLKAEG